MRALTIWTCYSYACGWAATGRRCWWLRRVAAPATLWSCDFSYDYVKINADYRS